MQRVIVIAPDDADLSPFYEALTAHKPKTELTDQQRALRAKKARERYHAKKRSAKA